MLGIGLAVQNNELSVIDFGGGGGSHYTVTKRVFDSNIKWRWNVVETQAMANAAKILENNELHFFSDIQEALKTTSNFDLLLSSGTLHCCEDPLVILQNLVALKARYLYITRTCFNEGSESLIIVQNSFLSENGPGIMPSRFADRVISYPNVFIPIAKVESVLQSEYKIRFKIQEDKDVFRIGKDSINMYGYFWERSLNLHSWSSIVLR